MCVTDIELVGVLDGERVAEGERAGVRATDGDLKIPKEEEEEEEEAEAEGELLGFFVLERELLGVSLLCELDGVNEGVDVVDALWE